jgi:hypothetical protein
VDPAPQTDFGTLSTELVRLWQLENSTDDSLPTAQLLEDERTVYKLLATASRRVTELETRADGLEEQLEARDGLLTTAASEKLELMDHMFEPLEELEAVEGRLIECEVRAACM